MIDKSNRSSANNRRIAKNTLLLYVRMLFLMAVNLYTSRVILEALGVQDYGIYNAVGGFIAMFSMISSSLTTAISRFLTVALGKGNRDDIKKTFSTSLIIQLALGVIIIVLVESFGVWFLNTEMTIPEYRVIAANWVLQLSLITFLFNLLNVPYNATLIAHEKMGAFAYIGIFEGLANLGVAFIVLASPIDNLICYAIMMCIVAVVTRAVYTIYCKRHFDECSFKWVFDKNLLKEMFGFAGWNFIGSISGLLRSQGINILFNVYNGPIVNAARGLAVQVESAITKFSGGFYTAVQPQITKSIAVGEYKEASMLACRSSRLAFFLLMLLSIPLLFEPDFLLGLWLKEVPEHTASFLRIIAILTLLDSVSQPLIHIMLATGDIKKYQILVGSINLLNFPCAWAILFVGGSPELAQMSLIFFSAIALIVRVSMLNRMVKFPVRDFLLGVCVRCLCIAILSAIAPIVIVHFLTEGWLRFIMLVLISELSTILIIMIGGLNKGERDFILSKIKSIAKR